MHSHLSSLPAIVIVAFDRPASLERILGSIARADYAGYQDIPLVISVDKSDCAEVLEIAEAFVWKYGTKRVIAHEENEGLRNHIISCGDLTEEYGAIILLEDDLYVSPAFYDYAVQAMAFYGVDETLSGISLYSYDLNEHTTMRFCAIDDGFDTYFIQTASSWGQLWTKAQWSGFRSWYAANAHLKVNQDDPLPDNVINWGEKSWKKYFIKYMVFEKKYFVYPRVSLTTNLGEVGTHTRTEFANNRVSLAIRRKTYEFSHFGDSICVYDSHYELEARCLKLLNDDLAQFDFECDLYGIKRLDKVKSKYLLSIRDCTSPILSYASKQMPYELNMVFDFAGGFFHLGKVDDFEGIPLRKQFTQLKGLHKDLGWRRYGLLFLRGLWERIIDKIKIDQVAT